MIYGREDKKKEIVNELDSGVGPLQNLLSVVYTNMLESKRALWERDADLWAGYRVCFPRHAATCAATLPASRSISLKLKTLETHCTPTLSSLLWR